MTSQSHVDRVLAVLRATVGPDVAEQYMVLVHVMGAFAARTRNPTAILDLMSDAIRVARAACVEADAERPKPS